MAYSEFDSTTVAKIEESLELHYLARMLNSINNLKKKDEISKDSKDGIYHALFFHDFKNKNFHEEKVWKDIYMKKLKNLLEEYKNSDKQVFLMMRDNIRSFHVVTAAIDFKNQLIKFHDSDFSPKGMGFDNRVSNQIQNVFREIFAGWKIDQDVACQQNKNSYIGEGACIKWSEHNISYWRTFGIDKELPATQIFETSWQSANSELLEKISREHTAASELFYKSQIAKKQFPLATFLEHEVDKEAAKQLLDYIQSHTTKEQFESYSKLVELCNNLCKKDIIESAEDAEIVDDSVYVLDEDEENVDADGYVLEEDDDEIDEDVNYETADPKSQQVNSQEDTVERKKEVFVEPTSSAETRNTSSTNRKINFFNKTSNIPVDNSDNSATPITAQTRRKSTGS